MLAVCTRTTTEQNIIFCQNTHTHTLYVYTGNTRARRGGLPLTSRNITPLPSNPVRRVDLIALYTALRIHSYVHKY